MMYSRSWRGALFTARLEAGVVRITDGNLGGMSVTNDADGVVDAVMTRFPEVRLHRLPIVYRDSEGRWDGMLYDLQGRFTGFDLIAATSEDEAVRLVNMTSS